MTHGEKILSFRAAPRRQSLDERARELVLGCRKVAERTLPMLMNSLFEKLDDALYELADKAETNQLQTSYFNAMRVVRRKRSGMQARFVGGVLDGFDRFWEQGPRSLAPKEPPSEEGEGLALLDDSELEETLAVSNLVSKGENRYQRELYALDQRFSALLGGIEVDAASNPLGPAAVCNRFHEANGLLGVDTPVSLVIYKLFDKHVMNYVGGLYEEINALLGHAGISLRPQPPPRAAPGRDSRGGSPWGGARPRGAAAYGPPAGLYAPGHGSAPESPGDGRYVSEADEAAVGLFPLLQELLVGYRAGHGQPVPPAAARPLATVEQPELLGVLSQLQQTVLAYGQDTGGSVSDLRRQVADQLRLGREGEDARALEKTDQDALDVISMLFEFVLDDPNLPDPMKVLITRLQIPMVKLAIMDKSFFSRKLHPARRLLNSLARAAVGWSDEGDRSENSLYARIESIVNRVVAGFEEDPSLFEQLDEEFEAYLERERRGAEIAEARTAQVIRGKEQLRVAKDAVAAEIAERLRVHPHLPLVARELLEQAWKDVLLLTYLRQGADSDAWHDALALADRLLWSVAPKTDYASRQELLRTIPDLLRNLREGLNGISYDQHETARLFKDLQACHIACLRGVESRVPEVDDSRYDASTEFAGPAVQTADPEHTGIPASTDTGSGESVPHDRYSDMAENLAMGTWLELTEDDGRRVRVKLSWKSDVSDAFVFVNRKGVKILEMTLAGVAKALREGTAAVLRDVNVPIMDRALGAMLETLRGGDKASR